MRHRLTALLAAIVLAGSPAVAGLARAVPPPSATDDSYMTDEDTPLEIAAPGLLANDGAPGDGNVLCVAGTDSHTLHGDLSIGTDGSFTYTPAANYNGDGADSYFTYTMLEVATGDGCDGTGGSTARVEITVNPVNDAPAAKADTFKALKNETLVINAPGVLSNDTDIDGDSLTAEKATNPSHGVVVLASDGSFSYTPNANFTGSDSFSYKAFDGTARSAPRVVTITVSSIPPINTPTPAPTPTPSPTPQPTPQPTLTPDVTPPVIEATLDAGASPTAFVPPTPQLSGAPTADAGASVASLAPGQSAQPSNISRGGFGSPLTILLGVTLLALIVGVAVAMYGPRWMESRRNRDR